MGDKISAADESGHLNVNKELVTPAKEGFFAKMKRNKPPASPSVPLFKLWRYANFVDFIMIIGGCFTSIAMGALVPCSVLVLGDILGGTASFQMGPSSGSMPANVTKLSNGDYQLPNGGIITKQSILDKIDPTPMYGTILYFVYFGFGLLIFGWLSQFFWVTSGNSQTKRIRELYLYSILRQDLAWFDLSEEGSLTTRLAQDTQLIQDGISEKAGTALQSISQFIAGFTIAFIKGPKLALVLLAALPLMGIVGALMIKALGELTGKGQDAYANAGAVAEQVITGIRTVYSFSLQSRFLEKYNVELQSAYLTDIKKGRTIGGGFGGFMLVMFSTYALAFWYGSKLVLSRDMKGQDVLVTFFSMLMGAMSLMTLPTALSAIASARGAAYKIYSTIDRVPSIDTTSSEGEKPKDILGAIEFRNVEFSYPSRPDTMIFKNLSVDIKPGKTLAFVGPSGSGKSTTVQLIQRFYDPNGGDVFLDSINLKSLNVQHLRQLIGVVSQEPVLFNLSIRENILLGLGDSDLSKNFTEKELIDVCIMANCHNFIMKLPKGYDTNVGEHGGMLSGGQKQRIAIARALIKNPKVLLLDEATSALDTQSERVVQAALDAASKNRTTIIIAHRLSTIKNADTIVVLDKGEIIEKGTHNELLGLNGTYSKLVEKQKLKMEVDDVLSSPTGSKNNIVEEDPDEIKNVINVVGNSNGSLQRNQMSTKLGPDGKIEETRVMILDAKKSTKDKEELEKLKKLEEDEKMKKLKAPLYRVWMLMKPEWSYVALGCFGAAIAGTIFPLFGMIFAKISTLLLDESKIDPGPFQGANLFSFLFLIIGIVAFIAFFIQFLGLETAGASMTKRIRSLYFKSLMRQEVGFFDEEGHSLGALTSRMATDASKVSELVTKVSGDVVQLVVTLCTGLTIAFIHSWQLTLIILCVAPLMAVGSYFESRMHRGYEDDTKKAYEESSSIAAEAIKEIRTVTGLGQQNYFQRKFEANLETPFRLAQRKALLASLGNGSNQAVSQFANALGFYAGIRLALANIIEFDSVFTVLMAIMMTASGLGRASLFVSTFARAKVAAINIFELIDRVSSIDPDMEGLEPETIKGDFEFKDIGFTYPSRPTQPIFTGGFTFNGAKNTTIAIVGPSGCGKSTTIGLLERWYEASQGSVTIDGINVAKFQLHNLRKHLSIVGQEPVLFDLTIKENILAGSNRINVTDKELEEVAKMANIFGFVNDFPDKFETNVGDKGSQLSGGQKQRVAIARALIRNPKFLLLDEATSALDSESEKLVQSAIDTAIKEGGRTTITIAHRLSTIQDADVIIVVKDGNIVESGTHFELISKAGVYAALVKEQDLNILQ